MTTESKPSTAGGADIAKKTPGSSVILDRSDPQFLAQAHEVYADLRAQGAVSKTRVYATLQDEADQAKAMQGQRRINETFFVSHYDEVVAALMSDKLSCNPLAGIPPEHLAKMPPIPEEFRPMLQTLPLIDPPDHTRLRRLVQPSFGPRALEALRPRIQRLAEDMLDQVELEAAKRGEASPDRRIDLVKAFAYPFPVAVISEMLGIPEEDRQTIENLSEVRIDNRDPAAVAKTRTQLLGFANYLKALFERKRREPGEDMISQMIQAQEDGDKLSESELLSMVFILYLGGHITTVNLIGNGVVALLSHPEQAAKLRNNLDLVKNVVEETLRYWGPVDFTGSPRMTKESVELGGTNIPKGASVTVGFGSANRDPKQFTNPDTFDITRADAHRHLAFGRGIHLCLGAPLARMEGQIAFETLFRRFPEMRLALPVESLRWNGAMGMRGYAEVPILF